MQTLTTIDRLKVRFLLVLLSVCLCAALLTIPAYASTADSAPGFFDNLFEWVKGVFIPAPDYFPNQLQRLNALIAEKLGGVGDLYGIMERFVSDLAYSHDSAGLYFSIPDNHFFAGFQGFSVDLLTSGSNYIKLLRDVFSVFICLLTAIACYKKLVSFFSE